MKKTIFAFLILAGMAPAQNVRVDIPFPSVNNSSSIPYLIANLPPNAPTISVCNSPANQVPCTNYVTTYTSTGSACPNGAQDTPQPQPSACQAGGDAQGNLGFWIPAGKYDYTVCVQNDCFGPYTVTVGGSTGSNYVLQINGVSLSGGDTVNFNASTPAAPTNGINVTFATSKSGSTDSVSGAIIGDGVSTDCFLGTGVFGACPGSSSGITGTGTTGYIPRWTGSSTQGNSDLEDTSGSSVFNPTGLTGASAFLFTGAPSGTCSNSSTFPNIVYPQGCSALRVVSEPANSSTALAFGVQAAVSSGSPNPAALSVAVGGLAQPTFGSTRTIGVFGNCAPQVNSASFVNCHGVYGFAFNGGVTTLATSEGGTFESGTSVVTTTNGYGLHVLSPFAIGIGGTYTHNYGLYIEDQTTNVGTGTATLSDPWGIYVAGGGVTTAPHSFSTLPTCNSAHEGRMEAVIDSAVNTWGTTITGSGSDHVLGYCDGTNWTVAAK